jgi:hypothetical protein
MNIPTPDYDSIKDSLKAYLKSLPEYVDVDFAGSTIGTLIDLLAYNSTINTFYLNQVANEAFLRTATQRDSVIANAQDFGYPVTGARSAMATVHVSLVKTSGSPTTTLTFPANSIFTAAVGGKTFTFRTIEPYTLINDGLNNYRANVSIYEGKMLTHRFVVTDALLSSGFILPNKSIDDSLLTVTVAPSSNSSAKVAYSKATNAIGLDETSKVFFTRIDKGDLINVSFGDGVFGVKPAVGDFVEVTYLISSGSIANGVSTFGLTNPPANTSATISVIASANGGGDGETIESIKFFAPKYFESQGRAVTKADYQALIPKLYGNVSDVVVWGGEELTPKQYGRVFISVKPKAGYYMTPTEKTKLFDLIRSYNVVTVIPEIVDPDYTYLVADTTVTVDRSQTARTDAEIATIVSDAIYEYGSTFLGKFSVSLAYSTLSASIQALDPSFVSNRTTFTLEKRLTPTVMASVDISGSFGSAVKYGSLTSSNFTFNGVTQCRFEEGTAGIIDIVSYSTGSKIVVKASAGTINYTTGAYSIPAVYITSNDSGLTDSTTGKAYMKFTAKSDSQDIDNLNRNILEIYSVTVSVKGA